LLSEYSVDGKKPALFRRLVSCALVSRDPWVDGVFGNRAQRRLRVLISPPPFLDLRGALL